MSLPISSGCMIIERCTVDGWYAVGRHVAWDTTTRWLSYTHGLSVMEEEWIMDRLLSGVAADKQNDLRYMVKLDMNPVTLTELVAFVIATPELNIMVSGLPTVTVESGDRLAVATIRPDCLSSLVRGEVSLDSLPWTPM